MTVQDEAAIDRTQLLWDSLRANSEEESYDADHTLQQHDLFQIQKIQVTEKNNHPYKF